MNYLKEYRGETVKVDTLINAMGDGSVICGDWKCKRKRSVLGGKRKRDDDLTWNILSWKSLWV